MIVKDCMRTEFATVGIEDTFHDVKEKLIKQKTTVAIVRTKGGIAGMVTDTDVLAHSSAGKDLNLIKVKNRMSVCEIGGLNPCLQVFEESPVEEAAKIMAVSGVHHLLVWGKGGRISGVISSLDILKTVD